MSAAHPSCDRPLSGAASASGNGAVPPFRHRLAEAGLFPLRATELEVLQINVGYLCNQRCSHCHVEAGPHRAEVMDRSTMEACVSAWERGGFDLVDITGGAPEMNPDFPWLLDELGRRGADIIVRSNLTILLAGPRYRKTLEAFRDYGVRIVASLPCYTEANTDAVRGEGVFQRSVEALRLLNDTGYGVDPALELVLVYNPAGPALPPDPGVLEADYRRELRRRWGIRFTRLITMTNLPLGRFAAALRAEDGLDRYMETLAEAFNPRAARAAMCRSMVSVGWDGMLYDCDFNQMLKRPVDTPRSRHVADFDPASLVGRRVVLGPHCYGCTAGAGSSCQGATVGS